LLSLLLKNLTMSTKFNEERNFKKNSPIFFSKLQKGGKKMF